MATNGYQLIGIGQVQKSMGGAVTAARLDPMTAITNPAGLIEVNERADFSLEAFMPVRSVDFGLTGGQYTEGGTELYGIPAFGWVGKAFGKDSAVVGIGMYGTAGLGVDYGQLTLLPGAALGLPEDVTFDGYTAVAFCRIAPTVAWRITDDLSLGAAVHIGHQQVTIRQTIRNLPFWNDPFDPAVGITPRDINLDLGRPTNQMGVGGAIGLDYHRSPHWCFALTYMKAFEESAAGRGDVPAAMQMMTPLGPDSGARISLEEDSIGLQVGFHF
jgi:long-chain fatty acid transport protein